MSKQYNSRPSQILAIEDDFWAWCVDDAVFVLGSYIDSEMAQAENGPRTDEAKRQARRMRLESLLNFEERMSERESLGGGSLSANSEQQPGNRGVSKRRHSSGFKDPAQMMR